MKIKAKNMARVLTAIIVTLASLAGCSTHHELVANKDISVERIGSKSAKIMRAGLYPSKTNNIVLRGELKRRVYLRGKIPGHLHVELVDTNGKTFKEAEFSYRLKHSKSRFSLFSIPIPIDPTLISAVRVIQHDMNSQISDSTTSVWQDVNKEKQAM